MSRRRAVTSVVRTTGRDAALASLSSATGDCSLTLSDPHDLEWMRIALALAERGRGRTSPNPMVGCVIVSPEGVRVGAGAHERAGGPHAEIVALRDAGPRARGATLYCTLEPCCHTGRTGPCVVPVSEAGVRRVVVAIEDANPRVAGKGIAYLRERGIEVTVGVREAEAAALNRAFFTAVARGRPHVTLKVALSADGSVGAGRDQRTPLTSDEANRRVHVGRAEIDAIAIGSETAIVDDPELTARIAYRERPLVRVIFDTRLRTPPSARMFATRDRGPIVVVSSPEAMAGSRDRVRRLESAGAEVLPARPHLPADVLAELGRREIRSLLVEGGPTLHRAFGDAGLVDRVQVFVTPHRLGPGGIRWDVPAISLAGLVNRHVEILGPDVLVEGDVHRTH